MNTPGERVKQCRIELGMSQTKLASLVGITKAAVGRLEAGKSGSPTPENLFSYAKALKVSPEWLITGTDDNKKANQNQTSNVTLAKQTETFVPVISWVQAGDFNEVADFYEISQSEEKVAKINGGDRVYALYVRGDSMTAPPGMIPSFPEGYIIHVDPDQVAYSGDCVIAKLKGQDEVTFKQLKIDDRPYLKPLNPSHQSIFREFRIIGKVIGASMKL